MQRLFGYTYIKGIIITAPWKSWYLFYKPRRALQGTYAEMQTDTPKKTHTITSQRKAI